MAHDNLHSLRRPALLDEQGGSRVTQGVHAVQAARRRDQGTIELDRRDRGLTDYTENQGLPYTFK